MNYHKQFFYEIVSNTGQNEEERIGMLTISSIFLSGLFLLTKCSLLWLPSHFSNHYFFVLICFGLLTLDAILKIT